MGAAARAAAGVIEAAFPAIKAPVLQPEAGRAAHGHDIRRYRIEHGGGQGAAEQGVVEAARFPFQARQILYDVRGHIPGVVKARRVVIARAADITFFDAQLRQQAQVPSGGPVGEMPIQREAELAALVGRQAVQQAQRSGRQPLARVRVIRVGQAALIAQLVPEVVQVVPPFAAHPTAPVGHIVVVRHQRDAAELVIARRQLLIRHVEAAEITFIAVAVGRLAQVPPHPIAELVKVVVADRVRQRPDQANINRGFGTIRHCIGQDGARYTGILRDSAAAAAYRPRVPRPPASCCPQR